MGFRTVLGEQEQHWLQPGVSALGYTGASAGNFKNSGFLGQTRTSEVGFPRGTQRQLQQARWRAPGLHRACPRLLHADFPQTLFRHRPFLHQSLSDLQFRNCTTMCREAVILECQILTFCVCTHMGNENPRETVITSTYRKFCVASLQRDQT